LLAFWTHAILYPLIVNLLSEMKKVVIYSTPTCVYCNAAKEFFTKNDVEFENYNVAEDLAKRQEMIEKSNQMGVPVIFVDDEMVVGFDKARIAELLGITAN
jgi:glutaredoxin 3